MRLTLRTLLAYLDGILEPADAQDIAKKIEESEFATDLAHRIRDVMRRLRLGAPSLTDRSPTLDPNTVAEYLDNTLGSDGVTEFEKLCLDSDIHLAEVASCHQILTLVLGEPAEIDPDSRQRMYQLKDASTGSAPPPTPATGAIRGSTATAPVLDLDRGDGEFEDRKLRLRPTVPEYLREPRRKRRWWLDAAAAILILCVTVAVLKVLGQFDPGAPLGDALVRWGLIAAPPPLQLVSEFERTSGPKSETAATKEPMPVAGPATETVKTTSREPIAEPVNEPAVVPAVKEPTKESREKSVKEPIEPPTTEIVIKSPVGSPPSGAGPPVPEVVQPSAGAAKGVAEDLQKKPATEAAGVLTPKPSSEAPAPMSVTGAETGKTSNAESAAPPSSLPPEPLGRLMSGDQVLLKDDAAGGWLRVAPNQMLIPQRLLALPTYRPKVTLTVGVRLEILGGTQIELLASGPRELPGIRVVYGRVVMMPLAKAGSGLRVEFGNRSGVLSFSDAESVAALDVRRIHAPGTDTETGSPHVVADLYASTDSIQWTETGGKEGEKTLRLTPPQWVSFNAGLTSEPATSNELPKWIVAEPISQLDRRASLSVAQSLPTDRLARLALLELSTSRPQKEVKWLALRCLNYIGQYRDMVAVLNDPARKLDWPEYIDQLREAVGRDSESAVAVRLALETQYPQQAANLYRMLWGYSDKDLEGGADAQLVKGLDDDSLAVRVLSFSSLKDLTGFGLFYRPEQTGAKRQQSMLRWKQRLDAGEIRLKTPEEKAGAAAEEVAPPTASPSKL